MTGITLPSWFLYPAAILTAVGLAVMVGIVLALARRANWAELWGLDEREEVEAGKIYLFIKKED